MRGVGRGTRYGELPSSVCMNRRATRVAEEDGT